MRSRQARVVLDRAAIDSFVLNGEPRPDSAAGSADGQVGRPTLKLRARSDFLLRQSIARLDLNLSHRLNCTFDEQTRGKRPPRLLPRPARPGPAPPLPRVRAFALPTTPPRGKKSLAVLTFTSLLSLSLSRERISRSRVFDPTSAGIPLSRSHNTRVHRNDGVPSPAHKCRTKKPAWLHEIGIRLLKFFYEWEREIQVSSSGSVETPRLARDYH